MVQMVTPGTGKRSLNTMAMPIAVWFVITAFLCADCVVGTATSTFQTLDQSSAFLNRIQREDRFNVSEAESPAETVRRAFRLFEQDGHVEPDEDVERESVLFSNPSRPLPKRLAGSPSLREFLGRMRPSHPRQSAQFTPIGAVAEAESGMISDPGPSTGHQFMQDAVKYPSSGVTREIKVLQGRMVGVVRTVPGIGNVHQFLGLPYAAPPVGSQRFMPPVSPSQWVGLKVADHFGPVCPQARPDLSLGSMSPGRMSHVQRLLSYLENQSEDCLYLNVYAPATVGVRNPRLPVLVYIHGESLEWNAGSPYDGSVLAAYAKIIVVTFNFRLGILGFLRPGVDERTVSNFGLLDQVAALQWVKDNIEALGGDPQSVTLMGHSTGAACASLLLISPVSSNLFKRAILMSGTALSDWALAESPLQFTIQVAHALNCPLSDEELAACLRRKRLAELLAVKVDRPAFKTPFGPVVDGSVIPNEPLQLMDTYRELFSRYDLLMGVTESEAYHLLDSESLAYGVPEKERDAILRRYTHARFEQHPEMALARTLAEYAQDPALRHPVVAEGQRDLLLDILSDARVAAPVSLTAELHAVANPSNFFYVFTHRTKAGDYPAVEKSVHGEELAYVFGLPLAPVAMRQNIHFTQQEKLLSEFVMTSWSNFAKTGNPNVQHRKAYLNLSQRDWLRYRNIHWPEFDNNDKKYFNISIFPSVGERYRAQQVDYWNHVLPNVLRNPQPPFPPIWSEKDSDILDPRVFDGQDVSEHRPWRIPPATTLNEPRSKNTYGQVSFQEESFPPPHRAPVYGKVVHGQGDTPIQRMQPSLLHPSPRPRAELGISVDAPEENDEGQPETAGIAPSTLALSVIVVVGVSFLLVNACAFGFLYYKKNRLQMQQQFFSSQCRGAGLVDDGDDAYMKKAPSTSDGGFVKTTSGTCVTPDVQTKNRTNCWTKLVSLLGGRQGGSHAPIRVHRAGTARTGADSGDDLYEALRSASARGGRQSKCKVSREDGVDAHTKVRDWIAQEVVNRCSPAFLRREKRQLAKAVSIDTSIDQASTSTVQPATHRQYKNNVRKVSVAIDATPATRSSSVLKQVPIELSKSLDESTRGGLGLSVAQTSAKSSPELCSSSSQPLQCTGAINTDDIMTTDDPYQPQRRRSTTSINLQQQVPNTSVVDIVVAPSSPSPSVPSPVAPLQTFAAVQAGEPTRDINVTSRDETPPSEPIPPEEALDNIRRRNYPKVLPDFPERQYGLQGAHQLTAMQLAAARRRSLPPGQLQHLRSLSLESAYPNPTFLGRVPPAPPPRISSTLGRKPQLQVGARVMLPSTPEATEKSATPVIRYEPRLIIKARDLMDSEPVTASTQTSSTSVTLKRPEPRVIIKATSTTPVRSANCPDYGTVADVQRARAALGANPHQTPPSPRQNIHPITNSSSFSSSNQNSHQSTSSNQLTNSPIILPILKNVTQNPIETNVKLSPKPAVPNTNISVISQPSNAISNNVIQLDKGNLSKSQAVSSLSSKNSQAAATKPGMLMETKVLPKDRSQTHGLHVSPKVNRAEKAQQTSNEQTLRQDVVPSQPPAPPPMPNLQTQSPAGNSKEKQKLQRKPQLLKKPKEQISQHKNQLEHKSNKNSDKDSESSGASSILHSPNKSSIRKGKNK